jgi:uncharacterized protein YgbK (DUF1537 family)
MEEPVTNGSFTTKDMLNRMDGKLDLIASKQGMQDVEIALLKAENVARKESIAKLEQVSSKGEDDIAQALAERNAEVDRKFEAYDANFREVFRKMAYATGTIVGASFIFNALSAGWLDFLIHRTP